MSGNPSGGLKAKKKILAMNFNHYAQIGAKGGKGDRGNAQDKGFATMDKQKHLIVSAKGGRISKRRILR